MSDGCVQSPRRHSRSRRASAGSLVQLDRCAGQHFSSALLDACRATGASDCPRLGQRCLLPKTLYVRSDNDIFVSIYAGTISSISAPAELMPYFAEFSKTAATV